jgi:hypothetical protein
VDPRELGVHQSERVEACEVRVGLPSTEVSRACVSCGVCVVRSYHVLQVLLAVAVRFDAQPHGVLVHEQGRCTQTPHDRNTVSS